MTDIAERLRERAALSMDATLYREAADVIERLKARVAALEAREKMAPRSPQHSEASDGR